MRVDTNDDPLRHIIEEAERMFIVSGPIAGEEALASALGLKVMLELSGKEVSVIYSSPYSGAIAGLPGANSILRTMPARDLAVQFEVGQAVVEKVTYFIDKGVFNLRIKPQVGSLQPNNLSLTQEPLSVDAIIVLGQRKLNDLGELYSRNTLDFSSTPVVNIDYHSGNEMFGQLNVVDDQASGVSEIIFARLGSLGLRPNFKAAECLLFGLGLLESFGDNGDSPDNESEVKSQSSGKGDLSG